MEWGKWQAARNHDEGGRACDVGVGGTMGLGWHGRHSEKRKHADSTSHQSPVPTSKSKERWMHMHVQCRRAATLLCSLGSVQVPSLDRSLAFTVTSGNLVLTAEQDEETFFRNTQAAR